MCDVVAEFPDTETIEKIRILSPIELIANKVISYHSRCGKPKSGTDWRNFAMLLLQFPELKEKVSETLRAINVGEAVLQNWVEIARQGFQFEDEDEDLIY